jgi:hypothetical protein
MLPARRHRRRPRSQAPSKRWSTPAPRWRRGSRAFPDPNGRFCQKHHPGGCRPACPSGSPSSSQPRLRQAKTWSVPPCRADPLTKTPMTGASR